MALYQGGEKAPAPSREQPSLKARRDAGFLPSSVSDLGFELTPSAIAIQITQNTRFLEWVSAVDINGRTIWIADAHRGDRKRFIVRAEEKLTAFLELEAAIRACGK